MTRTEGAGTLHVEQQDAGRLPTGPTQVGPMWIKYKQFVSATGEVVERRNEVENPDAEAAWRQLARKARSRFAQDNPY